MKRSIQITLISKLLLLVLISSHADLQSKAQTDSSLAFFPLRPNDLWQYHYYYTDCCCNYSISVYYTEHIERDTILPSGFRYEILESSQPQLSPTRYLRVDTATANVYEFSGDTLVGDYLVDSLRATVGSQFGRANGSPIQCAGADTATIVGIHTTVKRFTGSGIGYVLAYGLGLAKLQTMAFECGTWNLHIKDLCYARIDGQEYGRLVGMINQPESVPGAFTLAQNYPDPFNPSTTIRYGLPHTSNVSLTVFNTLGQQVALLQHGEQEAGYHEVRFDGSGLSSGVYFYRIQVRPLDSAIGRDSKSGAADFVQTKRLLLLR
jgi:Secretion system C-terminal sorting domain